MKLLILTLLLVASPGLAIDDVSCLAAKAKFKVCAERHEDLGLPLRSCLEADSGFEGCLAVAGDQFFASCLSSKSQYQYCRENTALSHNDCLKADSGFTDCMAVMGQPLLCLGAKGGYKACREDRPDFGHEACKGADSGYAACRAARGDPRTCQLARRSFAHCRDVDRQSVAFCVQIGKGYKECRELGLPLGTCYRADQGYADCRAWE